MYNLAVCGKIDHLKLKWDNNKLNKYKTLFDFNQTNTVEKSQDDLISLISYDINTSTENCKEKILEPKINYSEHKTEYLQILPLNSEQNLKKSLEIVLVDEKVKNKINYDKLDLFINNSDVRSNDNKIKNIKSRYDSLILKKENKIITGNLNKTFKRKVDHSKNEISISLDKWPKKLSLNINNEELDRNDMTHNLRMSEINPGNNSQKSTNTNITQKTSEKQDYKKLYSYNFKKLLDKNEQIKEKISEKINNNFGNRVKLFQKNENHRSKIHLSFNKATNNTPYILKVLESSKLRSDIINETNTNNSLFETFLIGTPNKNSSYFSKKTTTSSLINKTIQKHTVSKVRPLKEKIGNKD